jgi:glutathione S-transferase
MILYGHPLSSYTWKALIPLYEKDLPFEFRILDEEYPDHGAQLHTLWPLSKFPVLDDDGQILIESSIVVEHLDLHHPGPRMIPSDPKEALEVRFMDRVFDNHIMANMQAIVNEHLHFLTETPDHARIARAKAALDTIYGWLNEKLPNGGLACGDKFTLADCAAAPALFYADWMHQIAPHYVKLCDYLGRLLKRPSVARTISEAEHCFHMVPLPRPTRAERA